MSGSSFGQRIPSSETTSCNCVSPDHSTYLVQDSPSSGVNGLVALNQGVIAALSPRFQPPAAPPAPPQRHPAHPRRTSEKVRSSASPLTAGLHSAGPLRANRE